MTPDQVLGEALRGRGVAFERRLGEGDRRGQTELIRDSLDGLTALADPS